MASVSEVSLTNTGTPDNNTECLICLKTIEKPSVLSCLHTICIECLYSNCSDNKPEEEEEEEEEEVECPLCSRIFLIPSDGANSLTNNFFTNQLLNIDKSTGLLSFKNSPTLCELCSDSGVEIPSTSYCIECDQRFCEKCDETHKRIKATKSHRVVGDGDKLSAGKDRLIRNTSHCDQHPNEERRLYCYDCKMIMCHKCTRGPNKRALSEANVLMKKFREQLAQNLKKVSAYSHHEQRKLIQLESDKETFMVNVDSARREILQKYEELLSAIQAQKSKLMNELNRFKDKVLKEMECKREEIKRQFVIREDFKGYCTAMMNKGVACNVSRVMSDLHARVDELLKTQDESDGDNSSGVEIKFKPSLTTADSAINLVGQLVFTSGQLVMAHSDTCCKQKINVSNTNAVSMVFIGKPRLLQLRNNTSPITGITVMGDYLYVAMQSSRVDVYDCNSFDYVHQLEIIKFDRLTDIVSCSHYNCLYLCDPQLTTVYRYDITSKSTSNWSATVRGCKALSVTKQDHNVLATLYYANRIQEYTTHGILVREINLDISIDKPNHCVQLSTGNYVVSHSGTAQHRVCIVDQSGRIVKSYGGVPGQSQSRLSKPRKLAVDMYDNVLVTDSSCKVKCC